MRILVVLILFLLGTINGERVSDNGDGCGYGNLTPTSVSEICFHESQIRKADSLYKNYLPQSNFEEVKTACEHMSHHADILSAAVRKDGSLVLNGNRGGKEGELGFFTVIMDIHGQPLNVEESMALRPYSFYPNPANDVITISFSPDVNAEKVEIYGMDGKLYHEQNFNMETVNINSLSNGVYMMKVVLDNGTTFNDKIVVK